ncbi:MAG: RsmB/NOP family class I SAM-dependent RNA methyltransferase [Mucilaginibacter polytrichastri]|nr:RsmB/NOP family class I SAM-dependent RNA methyltransferase [Mucilaginibacter polytrichastri]
MKAANQLKTFLRLLDEYPGNEALHRFLPLFFRRNKQMGSTDRRIANRLIYNYFRIGRAIPDESPENRLLVAEFLCNQNENSFLTHFQPELARQVSLPPEEKLEVISALYPAFRLSDVFPFTQALSAGVDTAAFLRSHFVQPDLFIRVHHGEETMVKTRLARHEIVFREEWPGCIALPNGTKLDPVFPERKPFEIQDRSSQLTGEVFKPQQYDSWWDACAASGGKSLLLHSLEPQVKLLVSDMRESVLNNLDERFRDAGIKNYQRKQLDLMESPKPYIHSYAFDGIILDAPCTGSGTWGRTPELISRFNSVQIAQYQHVQKSIVKNVVPYLKPGKPLIYITCSVFKAENEDVVDFICAGTGLKVESAGIIPGYNHRADSMYAARLISPA